MRIPDAVGQCDQLAGTRPVGVYAIGAAGGEDTLQRDVERRAVVAEAPRHREGLVGELEPGLTAVVEQQLRGQAGQQTSPHIAVDAGQELERGLDHRDPVVVVAADGVPEPPRVGDERPSHQVGTVLRLGVAGGGRQHVRRRGVAGATQRGPQLDADRQVCSRIEPRRPGTPVLLERGAEPLDGLGRSEVSRGVASGLDEPTGRRRRGVGTRREGPVTGDRGGRRLVSALEGDSELPVHQCPSGLRRSAVQRRGNECVHEAPGVGSDLDEQVGAPRSLQAVEQVDVRDERFDRTDGEVGFADTRHRRRRQHGLDAGAENGHPVMDHVAHLRWESDGVKIRRQLQLAVDRHEVPAAVEVAQQLGCEEGVAPREPTDDYRELVRRCLVVTGDRRNQLHHLGVIQPGQRVPFDMVEPRQVG